MAQPTNTEDNHARLKQQTETTDKIQKICIETARFGAGRKKEKRIEQ
jgi:hypothetical protein